MWTTILGLASSALALLAKIWGSKDAADANKAGQAEQKAADQAPVIVAQDSMAKAAAEPAGRDATGKALGDGSY